MRFSRICTVDKQKVSHSKIEKNTSIYPLDKIVLEPTKCQAQCSVLDPWGQVSHINLTV